MRWLTGILLFCASVTVFLFSHFLAIDRGAPVYEVVGSSFALVINLALARGVRVRISSRHWRVLWSTILALSLTMCSAGVALALVAVFYDVLPFAWDTSFSVFILPFSVGLPLFVVGSVIALIELLVVKLKN